MGEYKRYFHASYSHDNGFGAVTMTTSGTFPSSDHIAKSAKDSLSNQNATIVVINIFEMNHKDFDDFVGNTGY